MAETKKKINICWLTGNFFERKRILDKIKASLDSQGGYELSIYGSEESFEFIYTDLMQNACFEETQRLVILNDWPSIKTTRPTMLNHFVKMCEAIARNPNIVLVCNNLQTESKKVLEAIEAIGKIYDFDTEVPQWNVTKWLNTEFAKRGKEAELNVLEALAQATGTKQNGYIYDVERLYIACNEICDFVGNRTKITEDDVWLVKSDSSSFIVWNLYNALDDHNICDCLSLLEKAVSEAKNSSDFDSIIEGLFRSAIWRYRLLLMIKDGSHQGWDTAKIKYEISNVHKIKREGNGFRIQCKLDDDDGKPKPIYSEKMVDAVIDGRPGKKPPILCYERAELFKLVKLFDETFQRIRAGGCSEEKVSLIQWLFMAACKQVPYDDIEVLRRINDGRFC